MLTIANPPPLSRPPFSRPATPRTDLAALKAKQQATWASGDYSFVASRIVLASELLCEAAELQAGWRVLDVATGSGNAAIAAARRGCRVVGADYVPALLDVARNRAQAERLDAQFTDGDAENLPFPTASFDAVLSVFGSMFAPNHQQTAAQLARVCRPGGVIALASWTPDGFIGEMFKLINRYIPPTHGLTSPARWGDESYLRSLFIDSIGSMSSTVRTQVMRFASPRDFIEFFRAYYGPTLKTFEALPPAGRDSLEYDLVDLIRRFDRNDNPNGPVAIAADYLETVIHRH